MFLPIPREIFGGDIDNFLLDNWLVFKKETPDSVQEVLKLYKNGIIDGEALNTALKALNNAPPPQEPQKKLSEIK